jgi:ribonuclease BN (tRNA processing enzyme)
LSPEEIAERILAFEGRALLVGGTRSERESKVFALGAELRRRGIPMVLVSADPGLPLLGPPGAVSRGRIAGTRFEVDRSEALCTLDALRFRLPLVLATKRLLEGAPEGVLLAEAPGVNRGMAGAELLSALAESLSVRVVLSLGECPYRAELGAAGASILELADGETRRDDAARSKERRAIWDRFLQDADDLSLDWRGLRIVGAPPPRDEADGWPGRQLALLGAKGETVALGEVESLEPAALRVRMRRFSPDPARALLVRDARRDARGLLSTDRTESERPDDAEAVSDLQGRPSRSRAHLMPRLMTLASAKALLVNGIFGDPLLHVRFRHLRRSLLFDLGDPGRLPARIAHQVTDVFVSHAHIDHIGGFLGLLRCSIGSPGLRRLYGPPGLTDHVEGMIAGIIWDRIGDRGPVFEVAEVHAETPPRLIRFRLKAGRKDRERLEDRLLVEDVLLAEPVFRVRAATLDHGIPVLAFAFEETRAVRVLPDRLAGIGLSPGPWLSDLKRLSLEGRGDETIELPDGSARPASEIAREILELRPGQKLAYATDLADHEENRRALCRLAAGARVLFCEASFLEEDRHLARATSHLTARSCGEIAAAAGVETLVPFHFSKRYESDPSRVYREVRAAFPDIVVASP